MIKGIITLTLKELLHDDYCIGPSCSKEEINLLLRDWLCSQKKKSESAAVLQEMLKSKLMKNTAQLSYWEGNDGRREAVKHFTKYAIICSPDTEIISYTTEPNAWFNEDEAFLLLWNKIDSKRVSCKWKCNADRSSYEQELMGYVKFYDEMVTAAHCQRC